MKRLLLIALVSAGLVAGSPAFAIDVQAGGRGGAAVTVGAATVDRNDQIVERCECDGGPLQEIVVNKTGGGTVIARIDRLTAQTLRTNDLTPQTVGQIFQVTNLLGAGENAIVILVAVRNNILGTIQTIAVRRTAFTWTPENGAILTTSLADLQASVRSYAPAPGA
jgi:hypothetical protein